jgi:hypothetical protein
MAQDGLCNRPNKDGSACKNVPMWGTACNIHTTDDERREHHAERDYQWKVERAEWKERQLIERHDKMIRCLAAFVAEFAPFDDDEVEMAERTLTSLLGSLHGI